MAEFAKSYDAALEVLIDAAQRYIELQNEIDDANPYSPNSVQVLGRVRKERAKVFLRDMLENRSCGMAQGDVKAALDANVGQLKR